ncbi:lipoyltransferase [Polychaeton citri CBS 116435]|uniref:Octanoyltransferase n=1 Tax=Polychaeton citri CBS 116435 TaxID=1314669 RepID=A0A9P4QH92_9PEZI|nr:lipoyltransferase [Polychaeton citri CBS 116435]
MILRHLHLPGLTPYLQAAKLQDRIVRAFLAHKAAPSTTSAPCPTIITTQFHPVYTCGRREVGSVSPEQQSYLAQGLGPDSPAEFHEALRGGQTTFHGPGQLVAYPVIDLKRHSLSARCYVNTLEGAVIDTCKNYGVASMRTDNPGVWVDDMHKICALGVHLRRNISSHGIGLNVSTPTAWFDRIVACGLEGKKVTSLQQQGVDASVVDVGSVFVKCLAERLKGVEAVISIEKDALSE